MLFGILRLLLIESLGILRTGLLNRLNAGEFRHWVNLFVEVFGAEIAEIGERKYRLSLLGFISGDLNVLFLLNDFDLSLEEAFTTDHLSVFNYHRLHLGW